MPPVFPKVLISRPLFLGSTVNSVNITVYFTGSITFKITANGGDPSPTWDTVSLTSGSSTDHTFTLAGSDVRYFIIGGSGSKLYTPTDIYGDYSAPMIKVTATYA